jgi:hypothetical protein
MEKVVQKLKKVITEAVYPDRPRKFMIPLELAEDALALLKAQEPRVMALSWVRNLKASTPVWLEDVDKKNVIGALFMQDYSGTKCVDFAIVRDWEFKRVMADYMDYGVRWRCWTSRPDQATREATPWDAQEQRDYEAAVEMAEYCERYEPTYNADDGSM